MRLPANVPWFYYTPIVAAKRFTGPLYITTSLCTSAVSIRRNTYALILAPQTSLPRKVILDFCPDSYFFSRFWFISQVCRVCSPGLRPVGFAEFWLADQACSLVLFFVDCEFLLCWYLVDGTVYGPRKGVIPHCGDYSSIRALCSILPAVIRFVQCVRRFQDSGDAFPHLVNAGKYSTTLLKGIIQSI